MFQSMNTRFKRTILLIKSLVMAGSTCLFHGSPEKKILWMMGVLGALALAPYHYWVLGCFSIGYVFMVGWRVPSCSLAWRTGWWWGLGFYMGSLYWIGHSLWVDAARFAWLWPGVVLGGPAFLAVFPGLMMVAIVWCRQRLACSVKEYVLLFVLFFSLTEWIQGHVLTGFPWNLTAYMWGNTLSVMQMAAVFGSYGLSLLTVLWIACMGGVILKTPHGKGFFHALMGGCVALSMVGAVGQVRLHTRPSRFHETIVIRCVQPCIAQKEKMDQRYDAQHWKKLQDLSLCASTSGVKPTLVIWPEGAFPWCMTPQTMALFPDIGCASILFGADYRANEHTIYNSLLGCTAGKRVSYRYAKMHLVPGGEYFPCRSFFAQWLPAGWLHKITPGSQDFSDGPPKYTIHFGDFPPFRCVICYESIFPGTIRNPAPQANDAPPEWILSITNDGWFGQSSGPHQHFLSARFRAIEEGLPLVRVANTGISAIVDPLGRIVQALPLFQEGVVDGYLPRAVPITVYGRFQNRMWLGMIVCLIVLLFGMQRVRLGKD